MNEDIHTNTATYCSFYICEADNKSKYYQIARYERRLYLTEKLDEQKKLITKRKKQIKEAEKEMSKAAPGSAEYRFLKGKIENRSKYLLQAEMQFAQIQTASPPYDRIIHVFATSINGKMHPKEIK
jgi:hypothetical protein